MLGHTTLVKGHRYSEYATLKSRVSALLLEKSNSKSVGVKVAVGNMTIVQTVTTQTLPYLRRLALNTTFSFTKLPLCEHGFWYTMRLMYA